MQVRDKMDWIMERSEEIAQEEYSATFYDLPDDTRMVIAERADNDFINKEVARVDAMFNAVTENKIMEE